MKILFRALKHMLLDWLLEQPDKYFPPYRREIYPFRKRS